MLAGAGIYLGRFLRFNTWDLLHRPSELLAILSELPQQQTLQMSALFGVITLGGYIAFYACHDDAEETRARSMSDI